MEKRHVKVQFLQGAGKRWYATCPAYNGNKLCYTGVGNGYPYSD